VKVCPAKFANEKHKAELRHEEGVPMPGRRVLEALAVCDFHCEGPTRIALDVPAPLGNFLLQAHIGHSICPQLRVVEPQQAAIAE